MFKILMNGNVIESVRLYGMAVKKAEKIKALFCKSGEVIIEDAKGRVMQRFGGCNVFKG